MSLLRPLLRQGFAGRGGFAGRARLWWRGLNLGKPGVPADGGADHFERCPFCGQVFDMRDLGQVLEHYECQLAAVRRRPRI